MGLLLSDNDLVSIQTALDVGLEIEMTRTLGVLRITVTTARAPDVWYPWRWLARVEIWDGHLYSTQWCVSSEEVKQACRSGFACASERARWSRSAGRFGRG